MGKKKKKKLKFQNRPATLELATMSVWCERGPKDTGGVALTGFRFSESEKAPGQLKLRPQPPAKKLQGVKPRKPASHARGLAQPNFCFHGFEKPR